MAQNKAPKEFEALLFTDEKMAKVIVTEEELAEGEAGKFEAIGKNGQRYKLFGAYLEPLEGETVVLHNNPFVPYYPLTDMEGNPLAVNDDGQVIKPRCRKRWLYIPKGFFEAEWKKARRSPKVRTLLYAWLRSGGENVEQGLYERMRECFESTELRNMQRRWEPALQGHWCWKRLQGDAEARNMLFKVAYMLGMVDGQWGRDAKSGSGAQGRNPKAPALDELIRKLFASGVTTTAPALKREAKNGLRGLKLSGGFLRLTDKQGKPVHGESLSWETVKDRLKVLRREARRETGEK
jgi:hypothetical protein